MGQSLLSMDFVDRSTLARFHVNCIRGKLSIYCNGCGTHMRWDALSAMAVVKGKKSWEIITYTFLIDNRDNRELEI